MAGMDDLQETIVTTREETQSYFRDREERYTLIYKTTAKDPLAGPFFRAVLSTICTQLYFGDDHSSAAVPSSALEIGCVPSPSQNPALVHYMYTIKFLKGWY